MSKIEYLTGDVLSPVVVKGRTNLIVHCVNNVYSFGSGVAGAIAKKWPFVKEKYLARTSWGLGDIQYVKIDSVTYIVNLCGQRNVNNFYETTPIRYESIQDGFIQFREDILAKKAQDKVVICFPRIGCNLAKGEWSKVEEVILKVFKNTEIVLNCYDLPGVTKFNP